MAETSRPTEMEEAADLSQNDSTSSRLHPRSTTDPTHGPQSKEHDNLSRDQEGQRSRPGRGFPGFRGRGPPPFVHFGRFHHLPDRRNCHEDPVDGADVDQHDEDNSTKASCRPRWGMGGRRGRRHRPFAHLGRFHELPVKGHCCKNCHDDEVDDVIEDGANVSSDDNEKTRKGRCRPRCHMGSRRNCPVFRAKMAGLCPFDIMCGPSAHGMKRPHPPPIGVCGMTPPHPPPIGFCGMTAPHPPPIGFCGMTPPHPPPIGFCGMTPPHPPPIGFCGMTPQHPPPIGFCGMTPPHPPPIGFCDRAGAHHGPWGCGSRHHTKVISIVEAGDPCWA